MATKRQASEPSPSEQAAANPYRFFSFKAAGKICGFGVNTITALVAAGAPVVARKINPGMLLEWIKAHPDAVGKIREDDASDDED